jgi:hypothetical protein
MNRLAAFCGIALAFSLVSCASDTTVIEVEPVKKTYTKKTYKKVTPPPKVEEDFSPVDAT